MINFRITSLFLLPALIVLASTTMYSQHRLKNSSSSSEKKIGVLLVNHGSRSATWRTALIALEDKVRGPLLKNPSIKGITSAFMEYTEPSIATRLKEFDNQGFTDVVIVPVFLTVSPHTFDDLPTIIGKKEDPASMHQLKMEKIERYTPTARVIITPNLDFSNVLKSNILRRTRALSNHPEHEGIVLIAYGDATYEKEWIDLMNGVASHIKAQLGITSYSYAWCGHLVHYDPSKTTEAINAVLTAKKKALVIPLLVAHDEMFQIKIIGEGISNVKDYHNRVSYKPDSILPDRDIEQWVIDIAQQYVKQIDGDLTDLR